MSFAEDVAEALLTRTTRRFDKIEERLDEIERLLRSIKRGEEKLMISASDIEAKVDALGTLATEVAGRLGDLAQEVRDLIANGVVDETTLQRIADKIDAEQQALQSAKDAAADVP